MPMNIAKLEWRRDAGGASVQNAYCNQCGTRVHLTGSGECPNGHARSALRDVREGAISAPGPITAPGQASTPVGSPNLPPTAELSAQIIGKLIVIIPAGIIVILAIWSGYAGSIAMGMTPLQSWLSTVGSLALTGAVVAMVVWNRRRKM
jgi:hypothetical protein